MTTDLRTGLREACARISPFPDYTTAPIQEGFDWAPLGGAAFDTLYLVVFRSVRRADADLGLLIKHDDRAYEEALRSGGLLLYFKGELNERRQCLSFCLWEGREHARRAAGGSSHARATELTARSYESYVLDRYEVVRGEDGLHFEKLSPSVAAV